MFYSAQQDRNGLWWVVKFGDVRVDGPWLSSTTAAEAADWRNGA